MSRSSAQAAAFNPTMALAIRNYFTASFAVVCSSGLFSQVFSVTIKVGQSCISATKRSIDSPLIVVVRLEGCGGGLGCLACKSNYQPFLRDAPWPPGAQLQ